MISFFRYFKLSLLYILYIQNCIIFTANCKVYASESHNIHTCMAILCVRKKLCIYYNCFEFLFLYVHLNYRVYVHLQVCSFSSIDTIKSILWFPYLYVTVLYTYFNLILKEIWAAVATIALQQTGIYIGKSIQNMRLLVIFKFKTSNGIRSRSWKNKLSSF